MAAVEKRHRDQSRIHIRNRSKTKNSQKIVWCLARTRTIETPGHGTKLVAARPVAMGEEPCSHSPWYQRIRMSELEGMEATRDRS